MTAAKLKSKLPRKTPRTAFERAYLLVGVRLRLAGRVLKPQLVRHITEHIIGKLTAAQQRRLITRFDKTVMRAVLAHIQPFAT